MKFRALTASEIDCRVSTINEKGLTLLLYKDARVDMNILDETFGAATCTARCQFGTLKNSSGYQNRT